MMRQTGLGPSRGGGHHFPGTSKMRLKEEAGVLLGREPLALSPILSLDLNAFPQVNLKKGLHV